MADAHKEDYSIAPNVVPFVLSRGKTGGHVFPRDMLVDAGGCDNALSAAQQAEACKQLIR